MDKHTIFFSHSSVDKDILLPIKEKVSSITANTLDIFMSSDGQSIPFGNNWVHSIEEGLNKAKIMFLFVTPNSINSAWIYFEAGFAYSKGIEVIPIGIGVNIEQLKPPLSLLQGFDIISPDSLNNIIKIINKKFETEFSYLFAEDTYNTIFASIATCNNYINLGEIFYRATHTISSQYNIPHSDEIIKYNIDNWVNSIRDYLNDKNIKFASYNNNIITSGISISIFGTEKESTSVIRHYDHYILFELSTQNFIQTFALYKNLVLNCLTDQEQIAISFELSQAYDCLQKDYDISSVINDSSNDFDYIDDTIFHYCFRNKIKFQIRKVFNGASHKFENNMCILISFNITEDVRYDDIIALFDAMIRYGLLFKK